jgi:hypothetical protein
MENESAAPTIPAEPARTVPTPMISASSGRTIKKEVEELADQVNALESRSKLIYEIFKSHITKADAAVTAILNRVGALEQANVSITTQLAELSGLVRNFKAVPTKVNPPPFELTPVEPAKPKLPKDLNNSFMRMPIEKLKKRCANAGPTAKKRLKVMLDSLKDSPNTRAGLCQIALISKNTFFGYMALPLREGKVKYEAGVFSLKK